MFALRSRLCFVFHVCGIAMTSHPMLSGSVPHRSVDQTITLFWLEVLDEATKLVEGVICNETEHIPSTTRRELLSLSQCLSLQP